MTPDDLTRARKHLKLTLEEMATMLGYVGEQRRQMMYDLEKGRRTIREPQRRLVEAYLAGYRPPDWPGADYTTDEIPLPPDTPYGGFRG